MRRRSLRYCGSIILREGYRSSKECRVVIRSQRRSTFCVGAFDLCCTNECLRRILCEIRCREILLWTVLDFLGDSSLCTFSSGPIVTVVPTTVEPQVLSSYMMLSTVCWCPYPNISGLCTSPGVYIKLPKGVVLPPRQLWLRTRYSLWLSALCVHVVYLHTVVLCSSDVCLRYTFFVILKVSKSVVICKWSHVLQNFMSLKSWGILVNQNESDAGGIPCTGD